MNQLEKQFKIKKENLLNIYCTAGYPQLDSTTEVMLALEQHGADMVEIGMPYADPIADGPVIQESNMVALDNGMNLPLLFKQLESVKDRMTIPVILMGYLNPVLQYGIEQFCADASHAGVSGIILPDLPMNQFEKQYRKLFKKNRLSFIFLITPETSEQRIRMADKLSTGFLYAVSASATTGNAVDITSQKRYFQKLKKLQLQNPVMIGFGINNQERFQNACSYAAGAIIGSAYIKMLGTQVPVGDGTKAFISIIKGKLPLAC